MTQSASRTIEWRWTFPLPHAHAGLLLGNGRFGAMVWGAGHSMRMTLGRADFWDHRGGMPLTAEASYAKVRQCLASHDLAEIHRLFYPQATPAGEPKRPSLLPVGRIDLVFDPSVCLVKGGVQVAAGQVRVRAVRGRRTADIILQMDMASDVLRVEVPAVLGAVRVRPVPAWRYVGRELARLGFEPPRRFRRTATAGWVQARPADPTLAVATRRDGDSVLVASGYGQDATAAIAGAKDRLASAVHAGAGAFRRRQAAWWRAYWRDVPVIRLPDAALAFIHTYGMYKFAGATAPGGVPAGLQGPWIEETRLPPWSADYHFNINVQMCYWPAYAGNRLEHLLPLFHMIHGWTPTLRRNAQRFLGIDDGLLLTHAVDDRGVNMGAYWTGTLDHGCTAWMAQMMFLYYRYTLDVAFLCEIAYPFMRGAMRTYEAMFERGADGSLALPFGVSAEYNSDRDHSWGRNASFQLACIHRLAEDLIAAARVLGLPVEAQWRDTLARLPKVSLMGDPGQERIALWDGQTLDASHRHHSHLAALHPLDVIDAADPAWRDVVRRAADEWVLRGAGAWCSFSFPWAAILCARLDWPDAAVSLLECWQRQYVNDGHGTMGFARFPGVVQARYTSSTAFLADSQEIMQLDGGMGVVAALYELLLHERRGVHVLFAGAPAAWREVAFRGMRTAGAFLVSARRVAGRVMEVEVKSLKGGVFRLRNPWAATAHLRRGRLRVGRMTASVLTLTMKAGERVRLVPQAKVGKRRMRA